MRSIALAFSFVLWFCAAAFADDAATFKAMLGLANKGDAEAQYHVGMMYNNGIGTTQDTRAAFGWFEKSAAGGDPLGAYKLGCYYDGQGEGVVALDEAKALTHKLVAANAGYSLAQFDVAGHYAKQGNVAETLTWITYAAVQGHDRALMLLSASYRDGRGVPQDISRAFAFYKLAMMASQSGETAEGKAVLDGMAANMSAAEREAAETWIAKWTVRPTDLTIKAMQGISAAEAYVQAHVGK